MAHRPLVLVTLASLVVSIASGCSAPTQAPGAPTQSAESTTAPSEKEFEDFNPRNFDRPTAITNAWLPLQPGLQLVYEGSNLEEGQNIPHRLVVTITDLTKVINGVRSVVSWDEDYEAGTLVEGELAFFAQDNAGAVWRLGEHPEEYQEGKFVEAPTWLSGVKGAIAGIEMQAAPQVGKPSYSQGWAPAVDFTDRALITQLGQKVCVPSDCYENVLIIDETSQAEPGAHQLKSYAQGVGNIRVDWQGADQSKETLELVAVTSLTSQALAEARAKALELEKHAYAISPDVYALTPPTEYPEGTPALAITPVAAVIETKPAAGPEADVVIYASDLSPSSLSELDLTDDPASPSGKMISLPNTGEELDPPPESDPHATFTIQVQSGIPYRCWIHMKVGAPLGVSKANVIWVQFTNAVDAANHEAFNVGTGNYLTAEGPTQEGWTWVECDVAESQAEPLIYFRTNGEVTVRLQAGAEGVGFDQFVLSPSRFLEQPPTDPIVQK